MIARAAEGSARDSLSIFDQAIAHSAGAVTAETVRNMLGLADRARVIDLFEHVMKGDMPAALAEFRAQYDTGADPATVLTDLAEFTHFVTRLRFVPSAANDASLIEDERTRGSAFAETLSVRILSRAWQMLLKGIPEVQSSNRPVSAAEMVLIRLAHAADLPTLDEAMKMLDGTPTSGNGGEASRPALSAGTRSAPNASSPISSSAPSLVSAAPAPPLRMAQNGGPVARLVEREAPPEAVTSPIAEVRAEPADTVPVRSLADIAGLADANRDMTFKVLLRRCVRLVRIEPGHLQIALTADAPKTLPTDLSNKLKGWTNRHWLVSLSRDEGGPTLAEAESAKRESVLQDATNDPAVAAILARFPGAKVIDVRIPESANAAGTDITDADLITDLVVEDDEN